MRQVTLQVSGMSCQHCVNSVENALRVIGARGRVDLKANSVVVDYDDSKISLETVKEAIEEQGYKVVLK
jgi:copper chaperone